MSDVIRLLPDSVANQIAAGEVIQRPAAVIKELVENAVDAGATDIRIYIKDAGRTLIQVVDNGVGMSSTDARMAFERHATSKIRQADDLYSLRTMGFRGEALPSICAISRVEVLTRQADSQMGTSLIINGSQVESQEPALCDAGTSISVKNIFYNLPARRKFLKSDAAELAGIMREFERLALVNNAVRMSIDTGTRTLELRAGTLRQRIGELWKGNLPMTLLPVEIDTALVKISGYISRPEFARRRGALQHLIVNGRNMRHPAFHRAVLDCYDSLIANDTQPNYFLKFEVDPSTIDVNISPTKNEIKFENEQQIRPLLTAAIRAALGKGAAVPSIDFNDDAIKVQPLAPGETPEMPGMGLRPDYNPFDPAGGGYAPPAGGQPDESGNPFSPSTGSAPKGLSGYRPESQSARGWESLYSDFMAQKREEISAAPQEATPAPAPLPELGEGAVPATLCMQYALKYIVTVTKEGVVIIDQHRAHVKVLYEEFMTHISAQGVPAQRLLFPELLTLDTAQEVALEEIRDVLARLGFILEKQGEGEWHLTATPAMQRQGRAVDMVMKAIESIAEEGISVKDTGSETGQTLASRMATLMARGAAIERGRYLTQAEMESLVADLFRLPDPAYTPTGRPIYTTLDDRFLQTLL